MTRLTVTPLDDRIVPTTLPSGFAESVAVAGFTSPTTMALAPDGRIFVAQQTGELRVVKGNALLPTPFLTLAVNSQGERGLLGVAFDPNFAANNLVYVYYTVLGTNGGAPHNRVSRFTANGDTAVPNSEQILLELEPLSASNHNGGPIQFGPDGKLYVPVGENNVRAHSQTVSNRLGKILRINPDGTIPADNPTSIVGINEPIIGINRSIWAAGLRNPFAIAFDPTTGQSFINDVGAGSFEEIIPGIAGANYGWSLTEGPFDQSAFPAFTQPTYAYPHSGPRPPAGIAITGGAFYRPATATFPADFVGDYFFADLVGGFIQRLDPATKQVTDFAAELTGKLVTDLDVTPQGDLLYLARGNGAGEGAIFRIAATNPPPVVPPTIPPPFSPPPTNPIAVGAGPGNPSQAQFIDPATGFATLTSPTFGDAFRGGVRVSVGDVTGDDEPDLIAGAGPGGGPHVLVIDGMNFATVRDLFAFESTFTGGVFVASADFNADGFFDVVVSPDVGGGPRVKVLSGKDGSTLADFFGIDDPDFRGGCRVGVGDINGDGTPDLIAAAGAGGGPRVAVFDGLTLRPGATPTRLLNDFFAFEQTLRDGAFAAGGDVDGDGKADVVAGAGPGGSPRIVVYAGADLLNDTRTELASFFAGDPNGRDGVSVAVRDLNGDGKVEVLSGSPPRSAPQVGVFSVVNGTATRTKTLNVFDVSFTGGVFVG